MFLVPFPGWEQGSGVCNHSLPEPMLSLPGSLCKERSVLLHTRGVMESALGGETGGPTLDKLQQSNTSDALEDTLNLTPEDEVETTAVEEVQDLKPEDLQDSAPPEATQDTKPGTGQVQQRDNCPLKSGAFLQL